MPHQAVLDEDADERGVLGMLANAGTGSWKSGCRATLCGAVLCRAVLRCAAL